MPCPLVSVVMPVFNGADYLGPAIDSILSQTFEDFELIIVNDGSTDATPLILSAYKDSRIRVLANDRNIGLIKTLNRGVAFARGDYVARMDADDVALSHRLAVQSQVMLDNPDLVLLGSRFFRLGGERHGDIVDVPLTDAQLRWALLFENAFGHSTCMFRRLMPDGRVVRYRDEFPLVEDYDLWVRLAVTGRIENLAEPLVWWWDHPGSVCATKGPQQWEMARTVSKRELTRLCPGQSWDDETVARLWANHRLRNFNFDEPGFLVSRDFPVITMLGHAIVRQSKQGQRQFTRDMQEWRGNLFSRLSLKSILMKDPTLFLKLGITDPVALLKRILGVHGVDA